MPTGPDSDLGYDGMWPEGWPKKTYFDKTELGKPAVSETVWVRGMSRAPEHPSDQAHDYDIE